MTSRLFASFLSSPWMGHGYFLVMALLSILLFEYRMINVDSSYYSFGMLFDEDFSIAHFRYGAFITQAIPLALVKAGASLKTVLIAYSLSFTLIHYLCWLFAHYVAKQPAAAWTVIFLQLLVWDATYFWPVSEVFLTLIYCATFFAWMRSGENRNFLTYLLPVPVFVLLILFTHPIALAPLFFMLGYEAFSLNRSGWKRFGALILTVGASILLWKAIRPPPSAYDVAQASNLENFREILGNFWSRPGPIQLRHLLTGDLQILLYFNAIVIAALLLLRKWKKAFLLAGGLFTYATLIGIVYQAGDSTLILENICGPFALFGSIFFLLDILPSIRIQWTHTGILLLLGFLLATRVWHRKQHIDYKFYWFDNMLTYSQELGQYKLVIDEHKINTYRYGVPWAMAIESTIYTTLRGTETPLQIFPYTNPAELTDHPNADNLFPNVRFALMRHIPDPPNQYFNFQRGPIIYLNEDISYPDSLAEGYLSSEMFGLEVVGSAPQETILLNNGVVNDLQIRISNKSPLTMVSARESNNKFSIGYHLGDPATEVLFDLQVNIPPGKTYVYNMETVPQTGPGEFLLSVELHHWLFPGQKMVRTWPVRIR